MDEREPPRGENEGVESERDRRTANIVLLYSSPPWWAAGFGCSIL
jgi:hypothetical protein